MGRSPRSSAADAATKRANSSFFRDGEDPWRGWRDGESPRDFQERMHLERKRQEFERQRAEVEWRCAAAKATAPGLGLSRGKLLVAMPKMRSFYTMSVVLLVETDGVERAYTMGLEFIPLSWKQV